MKQPLPMIMAGATASRIERWHWGQVRKYRNGLMRPEITQYLIKITAELVDILGFTLERPGQVASYPTKADQVG